jgi:hypothetical protein
MTLSSSGASSFRHKRGHSLFVISDQCASTAPSEVAFPELLERQALSNVSFNFLSNSSATANMLGMGICLIAEHLPSMHKVLKSTVR